ncbi:MAG: hypothetical protein JO224_00200 [Pelomonas sp.]|nr:hypothetical protein [Roseateles sp.]
MTSWRAWLGACICGLALAACGGGGGGGSGASDGGTATPAYSNVQPAAAPVAPSVDTGHASGTVSTTADTFDPSGHVAGLSVELHAIQTDGSLGPVVGTASTAADGSFSIAMPAGSSTADGSWMLQVQSGGTSLRAYLYPGAVRVDVGSEAWVREVVAAAGRVLSFPGAALTTATQVAGAFGLYADATGDQRAGLALSAAADQIVQSLASDHALSYVAGTLQSSGTLPAAGTGDIGAFYAMSDSYAALFVDGTGLPLRATLSDQFGVKMAADGTWQYSASIASQANGQWSPVAGLGGTARLTASLGYQTLRGAGTSVAEVSSVVGEFASQSFPVRPGARQLDARRITATQLNFTGGTDEQPLAFSVNEQVVGVENLVLPAGTFRTVRVVSDEQIVVPKSATTVTTEILRTTLWLAPGAGILKELDQVIDDGVEDTADASSLELTSAYADGVVWPAQVTIKPDLENIAATSHFCPPVILPALHRFVTVENGPIVQSSSTLALAVWDMNTGMQIGITRNFSGFSAYCPVATGDSASLLVPETFLQRNQASWPATAAAAAAQSDVVHQVSGTDLSDIASYVLPAVPDATQPAQYWPAELDALFAAPDGSGRFIAGFFQTNYGQMLGHSSHYVQVLGPGVASPMASVGNELLAGADWANARLFSAQNSGAFAVHMWAFTPAGGVDATSVRTISTGAFVATLWYASTNLLHLNNGNTIRIGDGSAGPTLPYTSSACGYGNGTLVCVDAATDRLLSLDPDALTVQTAAPLGSYLRSLSLTAPDFRTPQPNAPGIQFLDASTFLVEGYDVHVGRWASATAGTSTN